MPISGEQLEWIRESAITVVTLSFAPSMALWPTVLLKEPPRSGSGKSLELLQLHDLKYFTVTHHFKFYL